MADLKAGRIIEWHRLSASLSLFRLVAHDGARFPSYEAGQYIALRRDDCLLTRKVKDGDEIRYVPDLDDQGRQKRGAVTHSSRSPPRRSRRSRGTISSSTWCSSRGRMACWVGSPSRSSAESSRTTTIASRTSSGSSATSRSPSVRWASSTF